MCGFNVGVSARIQEKDFESQTFYGSELKAVSERGVAESQNVDFLFRRDQDGADHVAIRGTHHRVELMWPN